MREDEWMEVRVWRNFSHRNRLYSCFLFSSSVQALTEETRTINVSLFIFSQTQQCYSMRTLYIHEVQTTYPPPTTPQSNVAPPLSIMLESMGLWINHHVDCVLCCSRTWAGCQYSMWVIACSSLRYSESECESKGLTDAVPWPVSSWTLCWSVDETSLIFLLVFPFHFTPLPSTTNHWWAA